MKVPKSTTIRNIKVHTSYGISGVDVTLNLQELFQLSMKADVLGQHIGWLRNQKDVPDFAIHQLEELGYFLGHILQSAGFQPQGRAEIFRKPENIGEETE